MIVKLKVPLPAALVAVIVYAVAEDTVVGVPEIIPVTGSMDKPAGKELAE